MFHTKVLWQYYCLIHILSFIRFVQADHFGDFQQQQKLLELAHFEIKNKQINRKKTKFKTCYIVSSYTTFNLTDIKLTLKT